MKFPKKIYSGPLNKSSYQKIALATFLIQMSLIVLVMTTLNSELYRIKSISFFVTISVFIGLFFQVFVVDFRSFQNRFEDIYPNQKISNYFCTLSLCIPIISLLLKIFFCIKSSNSNPSEARFFQAKYVLLLMLPVSVLQLSFPIVSYLTASPSTYALVRALHGAKKVFKYKQGLGFSEKLIEEYQHTNSGKLSQTESVMLIAVYAQVIFKERSREIASGRDKEESNLEAELRIIEASSKILKITYAEKFEVWDYSLLQWLSITSVGEILILSLLERESLSKSNQAFYESSERKLKSLEEKLSRHPDQERIFSSRLAELKIDFSKLK